MSETTPKAGQSPKLLWFGLYVFAWIVALLSTAHTRAAFMVAWLFPIGLFGFLDPPSDGISWLFAGSWLVYILHAVLYFRVHQPSIKFILLLALAAVLAFNVAGCRHQIKLGQQGGFIHFP